MNTLHKLDHFPSALLDASAEELVKHLPGPALIDLPGRSGAPLFVSALLHGNEHTGFDALKCVLKKYQGQQLPRPLTVFIGNIKAAAQGVRTLTTQCDYNRAWPGSALPRSAEHDLMDAVFRHVQMLKPFASIDLHNNTGLNPHYACLNRLDEHSLHLARLFSRTVVYFTDPVGVQSAAMSKLCPAITVECGQSDQTVGTVHAAELVDSALHLTAFPDHPVPAQDLDLMRTAIILKVPEAASFSFDNSSADFQFRPDIDHLNFRELAAGTTLGHIANPEARLELVVGDHVRTLDEIIDYRDNQIRLTKSFIPSMFTLDDNAVRLDCLGYLMHRINRDGTEA